MRTYIVYTTSVYTDYNARVGAEIRQVAAVQVIITACGTGAPVAEARTGWSISGFPRTKMPKVAATVENGTKNARAPQRVRRYDGIPVILWVRDEPAVATIGP